MIWSDDAVSVDYKNNILSSEGASLGLPFAVETSQHSRSKMQKKKRRAELGTRAGVIWSGNEPLVGARV
jgi:hypothetical protein